MLDYNVPGGKLNRGLAVGDILCHLKQDVRRAEHPCTACQHHERRIFELKLDMCAGHRAGAV